MLGRADAGAQMLARAHAPAQTAPRSLPSCAHPRACTAQNSGARTGTHLSQGFGKSSREWLAG
jgi:hypothetical protein